MQGISVLRNKLEEFSTFLNDLADDLTLAPRTMHLFQTNSDVKALVIDMCQQECPSSHFLSFRIRLAISWQTICRPFATTIVILSTLPRNRADVRSR